MLHRLMVPLFALLAVCCCCNQSVAHADDERPKVAYTGVYRIGNGATDDKFPIYRRNQKRLLDVLRREMKRIDERRILPFGLLFDTDMEQAKLRIDNTLSLAFVVVRDDIGTESFSASGSTINKTVINVGLTAILYDTRKFDGQDRNTVVFSFPLVGYAQRLDGDKRCSDTDIDTLFVESAATALRENLSRRLASVSLSDVFGEVIDSSPEGAAVNFGSTDGIEEGQLVTFLIDGKKGASGAIVRLAKHKAVVELPKQFPVRVGLQVKTSNMRASSEETFQVVEAKVSSKKAAQLFRPEEIGPQVAQWFSNFLTDRGGKVVLPARVGGEWDQRATGTAFTLIDRAGEEHRFELPLPKYPVRLDITGVSSKVTDSNEVNDVCMFKVWMKIAIASKKYEKEFNVFSSKCLIKGIQSFEEKNEMFDLLYQLTAKIAREAEI